MAVYENSPYGDADIPQLIGVKTNIGGYFFDAFLKVDHNSSLRITDHPVEEGANITDHAYVEPKTLTMEIGMSDACISFINGQFTEKYTRSVSAFDVLVNLQEQRIPLKVHTRLKTYENMLIETITVPDDYMTQYGLRATVGLRQIIVVKTETVVIPNRVSKKPHKTGETNRGTVQPIPVQQSWLDKMIN